MTTLKDMAIAPKDGTKILIWGESATFTGEAEWIVGKWDAGFNCWEISFECYAEHPDIKPYGWIELPEEPKRP